MERPSERSKQRSLERRPYDFFRDQVLWLNRMKVEIEERYGRRVTANAMVQLALDAFIEDYKKRKQRSRLVTRLVLPHDSVERPERGSLH